jgi:hypothetical protein
MEKLYKVNVTIFFRGETSQEVTDEAFSALQGLELNSNQIEGWNVKNPELATEEELGMDKETKPKPCKVCKRPTSAKGGVCDRHRWRHGRSANQDKPKSPELT